MTPVTTTARMVRLTDLWEYEKGRRSAEQVRVVESAAAAADPTVFELRLPPDTLDALGFRSPDPLDRDRRFRLVRLSVAERECHVEVTESVEDGPVVIGWYALDCLGLQVSDGQLVEADQYDTALLPKRF